MTTYAICMHARDYVCVCVSASHRHQSTAPQANNLNYLQLVGEILRKCYCRCRRRRRCCCCYKYKNYPNLPMEWSWHQIYNLHYIWALMCATSNFSTIFFHPFFSFVFCKRKTMALKHPLDHKSVDLSEQFKKMVKNGKKW